MIGLHSFNSTLIFSLNFLTHDFPTLFKKPLATNVVRAGLDLRHGIDPCLFARRARTRFDHD
jgi:hypothetical protein